MNRKYFIYNSSLLTFGGLTLGRNRFYLNEAIPGKANPLYSIFKDPPAIYRPFVRWWWNGDKVEKAELKRELQLLKEAGIGGVEINPIKFPQRTDEMGIKSLPWLSDEWIDAVDFTLTEAKKLGLTCDLIVGSGWPFGAEYLQGEEQAQIITVAVKKVDGVMDFEAPVFDFLKEADPAVTSPYPHRKIELQKVFMVPDPMNAIDEIHDLSDQIPSGFIRVAVPRGRYAIIAQVKTHAFLEVINGAPGANGPVLNHYNKAAVEKYLNHMTDAIQQKIGPLKGRIRALFTDSMELEGANWCADMATVFQQRNGYDLLPYLPLVLFRIGGMGNVYDYSYNVSFSPAFKNVIERVRYDFEATKTALLRESFIAPFQNWCRKNGVLSRVQAYGRGYHPLEGSLNMDIPEAETWVKYGYGKEMPETDYKAGRAYTMVNKFVSSAAHLQGKRLVSCEECTNTDMVFNATLQMLKLCSDQSILSGITHSIYHGFNYSPPNAPFPGWVRYGNFLNERNPNWPFFKQLNDYKARLSALLQQSDFFAEIALMPGINDMWAKFGAQNEPFPSFTQPNYLSLIWEAIHQNGNACDYVSDNIIRQSVMKDGFMQFGARKYHTIFLVQVETLDAETARQLLAFIASGGKVFCIENIPAKGAGLKDFAAKDSATQAIVAEMKRYSGNFFFLEKPQKNHAEWFRNIQSEHNLKPYLNISNGNPFINQVRYTRKEMDCIIVTNSSYDNAHAIRVSPEADLIKSRKAYVWDPVSGARYGLPDQQDMQLTLYPADLRVIVFENSRVPELPLYPAPLPVPANALQPGNWRVTFHHINGTLTTTDFPELKDLKETGFADFAGTVLYQNSFVGPAHFSTIDLGVVHGISQVKINGQTAGSRWYGRHVYDIAHLTKPGDNTIEIAVTTVMGNYLKTLKDNAIAQYWTNEKRKNQPIQSMGLIGPVALY